MKRYKKYEYWPYWIFYAPFTPLWMYYSLKRKDLLYFCDANPGMQYGGFVDYSKYEINSQLPKKYIPKSEIIRLGEQIKPFENLKYPLVLKPDRGERGKGVEIVQNNIEFENYIQDAPQDVLIQEMVDYDYEFGVFFYKMPKDDSNFGITGITGKRFLEYLGDGKQSLKDFLNTNPRAKSNYHYLENKFKNKLDLILPKGESMVIEKIGNHSRGTEFYDASDLINQKVISLFKEIADCVEGFYVGRFDVKVKSKKDLETGDFLKIIEINGVNSEATHIYDQNYTLLTAYKEVHKHLKLVHDISKQIDVELPKKNITSFVKTCLKNR